MRFHRRTDPELPDHHRRDRSAWDLASRRHDHESSEAPRCWPHQMSASPSGPQSAPQPSWRSACGAATLPRTTKEGRGHWPLPSSHFTLSDACDSHTPSHALPDFHPDLPILGVSPTSAGPPPPRACDPFLVPRTRKSECIESSHMSPSGATETGRQDKLGFHFSIVVTGDRRLLRSRCPHVIEGR